MGVSWYAVVVEAADPNRLSRWWAEVLGYQVLAEDRDEVLVGRDRGAQPLLSFTRTTDGKPGPNRLHIDLYPDDRDAEVERLVDMGARYVESGQGKPGAVVLADPEGNEFSLIGPGGHRAGGAGL
ncbi:MAG TPA: VOC family protein [Micromonosporaceae bacterium]|nr:VOC family protein [Micromonosporaceae bacterium]